MSDDPSQRGNLNRRQFLATVAASSAGLALPRPVWGQQTQPKSGPATQPEPLKVGIVGVGRQGKVLLHAMLEHLHGIRVTAVCDIWSYGRRWARLIQDYQGGERPGVYEDYRAMLAKEGDRLDAVVVATPPMHHAAIVTASLKAGLHVYCETPMGGRIEDARQMAAAAKQADRLLQIGYQRRSNPFYIYLADLIHHTDYLGRLTGTQAQSHGLTRPRALPTNLKPGNKYAVPPKVLKKHGFDDMRRFFYWSQFVETSPGAMVLLGSHQLDALNWFVGALPNHAHAVGSNWWSQQVAKVEDVGYMPTQLDHILAMLSWPGGNGPVYGQYSMNYGTSGVEHTFKRGLTDASAGGYFEQFNGDRAAIRACEFIDRSKFQGEAKGNGRPDFEKFGEYDTGTHLTDAVADRIDWRFWVTSTNKQLVEAPPRLQKRDAAKVGKLEKRWELMKKDLHAPHLANFFGAVRGEETLNCPPETGFAALVSALKTHEAAVTGEPIEMSEADFEV